MNDRSFSRDREAVSLAPQRERCREMTAAYRDLLGPCDRSSQAERIYTDTLGDIDRLDAHGPGTIASIAILGHVSSGKTWLARCFFRNPAEAIADLRSGDHEDTQSCLWFGPEPPASTGGGRSVRCDVENLIDLGRPYIVCDTPGFSHVRAECRDHAGSALVECQVKLLVTTLESARDGNTQAFLELCEGSIVVPVIKLPASDPDALEPSASARKTVAHAVEAWARTAPRSRFAAPLFMPNAQRFGDELVTPAVQAGLRTILQPLIADNRGIATSLAAQADHRVARANGEALKLVGDILDRALPSLQRLDAATRHLSDESLSELVGDESSLKAVMRQQLRADWIDRTSDACFPYKSFLRTLALTAGAWDRLLFLSTGSLTSLATTALQAGKNVQDAWRFARRFDLRLAKRIEASLADRLQPDLRLLAAATAASEQQAASVQQPAVKIIGLEELQQASKALFKKIVARHAAAGATITAIGFVAAMSFLLLVAAPFISTVSVYAQACWQAATSGFSTLNYPLPTLAMLLGAAGISAAPSVALAWLAMIVACFPSRVRKAAKEAFQEHVAEIGHRLSDQRLRFEVSDARISALRKLEAVRLASRQAASTDQRGAPRP